MQDYHFRLFITPRNRGPKKSEHKPPAIKNHHVTTLKPSVNDPKEVKTISRNETTRKPFNILEYLHNKRHM